MAADAVATKEKGPFSTVLVTILLVVGALSFTVYLLASAFGGDGGARDGTRSTALSTSAIGYQGLYRLAAQFENVAQVRSEQALETPDLLVVALEPQSDRAAFQRLLNRRRDLPTLIIMPKWNVMPDPAHNGWVNSLGSGAGAGLARAVDNDLRIQTLSDDAVRNARPMTSGLLSGLRTTMPARAQVISGGSVEMLAGAMDVGTTVARIGRGPLFVIADPDLVNNQGLANRDNAITAIRMLRRMMPERSERIAFDLTTNGVGAGRSLLRTMLQPPFLGLTLALVLAAIIAGLHGAVRFGPPKRGVRAIPFGKAALVENSAALVRLSNREARVGASYADVVRDEAARVTAAPASLHGEALDSYLDQFGRRDQPPFSYLAAQMRAVADRASMMKAARALFSWKKDVIR